MIFRRASQKLASQFYGPYKIEQHICKITYKLKLLERFQINPIFPILLLKKIGELETTTIDFTIWMMKKQLS